MKLFTYSGNFVYSVGFIVFCVILPLVAIFISYKLLQLSETEKGIQQNPSSLGQELKVYCYKGYVYAKDGNGTLLKIYGDRGFGTKCNTL